MGKSSAVWLSKASKAGGRSCAQEAKRPGVSSWWKRMPAGRCGVPAATSRAAIHVPMRTSKVQTQSPRKMRRYPPLPAIPPTGYSFRPRRMMLCKEQRNRLPHRVRPSAPAQAGSSIAAIEQYVYSPCSRFGLKLEPYVTAAPIQGRAGLPGAPDGPYLARRNG